MAIYEITKGSEGVTLTPNTAGQSSPIVSIQVQPTKSYTVMPNALFQLFLKDNAPANLPDDSTFEMWVEDVSGDLPIRLRSWDMGRFNNANQFNSDSQIRLDIDKHYKLAELRKIIFKLTSTAVVDWTQAGTKFMLQVDRLG